MKSDAGTGAKQLDLDGLPACLQGTRHRIAGLFAGVGGLERGLHRAGHETVLLCENDGVAVVGKPPEPGE